MRETSPRATRRSPRTCARCLVIVVLLAAVALRIATTRPGRRPVNPEPAGQFAPDRALASASTAAQRQSAPPSAPRLPPGTTRSGALAPLGSGDTPSSTVQVLTSTPEKTVLVMELGDYHVTETEYRGQRVSRVSLART